jgi:hypothetical protein
MTDEEFLRALERCELAERDFGHAAHVRAAYLYLQEGDFVAALDRIRRAIRNYARHLGKPDRYHETITVAYVARSSRPKGCVRVTCCSRTGCSTRYIGTSTTSAPRR